MTLSFNQNEQFLREWENFLRKESFKSWKDSIQEKVPCIHSFKTEINSLSSVTQIIVGILKKEKNIKAFWYEKMSSYPEITPMEIDHLF